MLNHTFQNVTPVLSFDDPASVIWWFVACFFLHVIGVVANVALMVAVWNDRTSHKGSRFLVSSMAFANLLMASFFMPSANIEVLVRHLRQSASTNHAKFCTFFYAGYYTTQTSAAWIEVALAVNRLIAIVFPRHYDRFRSLKVSIEMVLAAVLIGVSVSFLTAGGIGASYSTQPNGYCMFQNYNNLGAFLGMMVSFIPYGLAMLVALAIFVSTCLRPRVSPLPLKVRHHRIMSRRMVVAQAMFASSVWCLLCTLPVFVVGALMPELTTRETSLIRWLKVSYTAEFAIDPLVFFAISSTYRQALMTTIRRWIRNGRSL
ncbi:hypothetical protein RvY_08359 [Ramazzottius varieornatus]|uniref:G-protein coupled receptors family 1 profile domain-containing protein n=1 Tax=Ramazzottius varieornatus TaxID=947166 RepID=A0A1D1V5J5_RAMVA|nr:hypothetical protein RvY_08359 [Ramazzottius varieornatus]